MPASALLDGDGAGGVGAPHRPRTRRGCWGAGTGSPGAWWSGARRAWSSRSPAARTVSSSQWGVARKEWSSRWAVVAGGSHGW